MTKMLDANQIEELKVKYFDYMAILKKEMRVLNFDIKQTKELLNEQERIEKRYIKFLVSDNTGKGEYRDSQVLPDEIRDMIENGTNLSEVEKENLRKKYILALESAKKYEQEYKMLLSTALERDEKIKTYKKEFSKLRRELLRKEKEYNENLIKVKKLDKKMRGIKQPEEEPKKLVKKPIEEKEQN